MEALIFAALEQALRTTNVNVNNAEECGISIVQNVQ